MLIMVAGGRDYTDEKAIREALEPYNEEGNLLLSGGARGADTVAEFIWIERFQRPAFVCPAPWDRADKAAGMMRTRAILTGTAWEGYMTEVPDLVLAFPGGRGTAYTVDEAIRLGIRVEMVGW